MKKYLLDLLFPRRCAVCDEPTDRKKGICQKCVQKIRYIKEPICMKCGRELQKGRGELCRACLEHKHYYIQGRVIYDYESMADSLFRFKYKGRQEYAMFYGMELYRNCLDWLRVIKPDAFVPVPIHASRMRKRGYNQAQLIARELSACTGIPVKDRLISRVRKTVPQKGLTPLERQNNLKKAFKLLENDVKLDTIVVIDDIYTTGSTINAVSRVLQQGGVKKIYYMALAAGSGN